MQWDSDFGFPGAHSASLHTNHFLYLKQSEEEERRGVSKKNMDGGDQSGWQRLAKREKVID